MEWKGRPRSLLVELRQPATPAGTRTWPSSARALPPWVSTEFGPHRPAKVMALPRTWGMRPTIITTSARRTSRAVSLLVRPPGYILRLIAVAHANGLEVHPDVVLDHPDGGNSKTDQPAGFAATGRRPRRGLTSTPTPPMRTSLENWMSRPRTKFGDDFRHQGRCSDSGNADPNCYARAQARAWFTWSAARPALTASAS